jgi:hypothetical protein
LCAAGLFAVLHFAHAQTTSDTGSAVTTDPDADVSNLSDLEVELKALEMATPLAASNLPASGNFYSAQHAPGSATSWPPLPGNIFRLSAWPLDTNIFVLDDLDFDYNDASVKTSKTTTTSMVAKDDLEGPPTPPGGGGSDTNTPSPQANEMQDFGTNLYFSQFGMVSNTLTGTATNTLEGVAYSVQTNSDLTTTNWADTGQFIQGSEVTNWTQFILPPPLSTNNLFFRLQSWASSDDSGIPTWWELKYLGQDTNVDPYADPTGDGYTLLQDFQNGLNPNVYITPLPPQGVTSSYNPATGIATVTWAPSQGNVTGYTIIDSAGNRYTVPASSNSITINVPDVPNTGLGEQTVYDTFQVEADYANGNSPESAATFMEPYALTSRLITGASNVVYLTVAGLPPNAENLSLKMIDEFADYGGDYSHDVNHVIAVSEVTNGLFLVPPSWAFPQSDGEGNTTFYFSIQCTNSDGSVTAAYQVDDEWIQVATSLSSSGNWTPPFWDGREQLKQNLEFQFRVADNASPFGLITYTYDPYVGFSPQTTSVTPTNYVYASFYDDNNYNGIYGSQVDAPLLNIYRPFEDNELYRNFVYSSSDMNTNGNTATGVEFPGGEYSDGVHLALSLPGEYQPTTNVAGISPMLGSSQWLCTYPESLSDNPGLEGLSYSLNYNGQYWTTSLYLSNNAVNYWGLKFTNVVTYFEDTNGNYFNTTINAGNSYTTSASPTAFFMGTTPPQFATTEYDFWAGSWADGQLLQVPILPGQSNFSPTNSVNPVFVNVGNYIGISSFAKLEVANGAYSGVYGYLQQYLDKAYQIDDNGNVTTNATGVAPYGSFFATTAGAAALETMPDPDTGQRGTGVVYCVSMNVDKNHDGTMDLSFNGPDATSQVSPMEFWVNNDNDGTGIGEDFPVTSTNDYDYNSDRVGSERGLEDFARLWICGVPALPSSQGYSAIITCNPISGSPAINVYQAETNGGTLYLTDTNIAQNLVNEFTLGTASSSGQACVLPMDFFDGSNKYLLFEGAGIGKGQFTLTIYQGTNAIAQASTYIDLHDVKDFIEQAVITNNMTSSSMSNWTSAVETVLPAVSSGLGNDTNLIVLVHGINVQPWDCLNDAETVYKRLYWAGFNGKFGDVKWPCDLLTPLPSPLTITVFNLSEFQGYTASQAMIAYLTQLRSRFPGYRLNLLVHSQGNSVVSEALKNGAPFDTYILTQGALPDSAYDVNAPTNDAMASYESGSRITPDWQPMGYHGVYTNLTGRIANFYNPNDPVLAYWITDQEIEKPSFYVSTAHYFYNGTNSYFDPAVGEGYLVTDPEESRAMVARSRTLSIGQSGPASAHGVIQSAVNLNEQIGFNDAFPGDHSAQWVWPIQTSLLYYYDVLSACNIPTHQLQ